MPHPLDALTRDEIEVRIADLGEERVRLFRVAMQEHDMDARDEAEAIADEIEVLELELNYMACHKPLPAVPVCSFYALIHCTR